MIQNAWQVVSDENNVNIIMCEEVKLGNEVRAVILTCILKFPPLPVGLHALLRQKRNVLNSLELLFHIVKE